MEKRELEDELQEVGLTKYQSSAYVAAVSLGSATPTELVEASEVPQARIYDIIDDLQEMGLVEVPETESGKVVRAPPPEIVLDEFRKRRIQSFSSRMDGITSALEQHHDYQRPSEGFVTMVSLEESAIRHIRQAIDEVEWWLTMALPVELYEAVAENVADAVDRGVTVRLIVDGEEARQADPRPGRMGPTFPEAMAVRHRPTLDTFAFADRSYGIFNSVHPQEETQPYIISQESNLVLLFQIYAEQVWTGSATIQADTGLPKRYLDPWRAIVDLRDDLDAGATLIAEVEGRRTHSRKPGTWAGEIVDYDMSGAVENSFEAVAPTTASLIVDTDEGEQTVGGWKATQEDIAADGITVSGP
ncbi:MAG: TrmB family transcriptional regulator [Haloarculaceae archaeon]